MRRKERAIGFRLDDYDCVQRVSDINSWEIEGKRSHSRLEGEENSKKGLNFKDSRSWFPSLETSVVFFSQYELYL